MLEEQNDEKRSGNLIVFIILVIFMMIGFALGYLTKTFMLN